MITHLFWLKTITNLFVGDMGSTAGVVDKTVQRDYANNCPTINASSLKGALRNYFDKKDSNTDALNKTILAVFGGESETDATDEDNNAAKKKVTVKGQVNFLNAQMVFYPIRGEKRPYYMATCPMLLRDFCERMKYCTEVANATGNDNGDKAMADMIRHIDTLIESFAAEEDWNMFGAEQQLDTYDLQKLSPDFYSKIPEPDNAPYIIIPDKAFDEYMQELPIIARNKLEYGISANLWYEEYVPRKTVFALTLLQMNDEAGDEDCEAIKSFMHDLPSHKVQIGGNATVGDGLCSIKKLAGDVS